MIYGIIITIILSLGFVVIRNRIRSFCKKNCTIGSNCTGDCLKCKKQAAKEGMEQQEKTPVI